MESLQKTPLHTAHLKAKAKMMAFGGWDMPLQYDGILAEHHHTRDAVSIFDTSHMGEFFISGYAQATGLDYIVTMKMASMPVKTCRYGFILNEQGGVMDDCIVFRTQMDEWFIVVNGATIEKDATHILKYLKQPDCFENVSQKYGKIDVQGPQSLEVLGSVVSGLDKLKFYGFDFFDCFGEMMLISRTGYTGEMGFELYPSSGKTEEVWEWLMRQAQVKPAGLGARDILRLEKGYSLYGHELSDTITPLEAGLKRFVDFEKDFFGKEALLKQQEKGVPRKTVGIISETRRAPRAEQNIFNQDQQVIGTVTSGAFSPCLGKGIGLGLVQVAEAQRDNKVYFGKEKNLNTGLISSRIFYKNELLNK